MSESGHNNHMQMSKLSWHVSDCDIADLPFQLYWQVVQPDFIHYYSECLQNMGMQFTDTVFLPKLCCLVLHLHYMNCMLQGITWLLN